MFILIVAAETFLAPSLTIKPNVWFLDMQHVTPSLGAVYRLWNDGNQKKKNPPNTSTIIFLLHVC